MNSRACFEPLTRSLLNELIDDNLVNKSLVVLIAVVVVIIVDAFSLSWKFSLS